MSISICLGTAQFGFDYGITNYGGKVTEDTVKELLNKAVKYNIKYLDTAQNYGNSEEVIGKCKPNKSNFEIISKLNISSNKKINEDLIKELEKKFKRTLINVKSNSINSLLVHDSKFLKNKKSKILQEWLVSLKNRKLIKNIGISIYNLDELNDILLDNINLIQIPISLYNQNAAKGSYLESLSSDGYLIHARSCFLQGLLLENSKNWPTHISKELREHHSRMEKIALKYNLSMLDLCLGYIKSLKFLDSVVIGLTNSAELKEFFESWNKKNEIFNKIDFEYFYWNNKKDLDPRFWAKK